MLAIEEAKELYAKYLRAAKNAGNEEDKDKYASAAQTLRERILASGEIDQGDSALEGAVQGITFGFSDELAGVGRALSSVFNEETMGEAYSMGRDVSRAEDDLSREANPWTYGGSEVAAGMLVPGGAAVKGAQLLSRGGRMSAAGRAITAGAGAGAVEGVGYSVGENVGEVARDAAQGAAIGGTLGPAVGYGIKKGAEGLAQVGSGIKHALAPDPAQVARQRARRVLGDEGITTAQQARTRLDDMGPEARIADLGPAARQEGVAVAKSGGAARRTAEDAVEGRQRGQEQRIRELAQEKVDPMWTDYRGFKQQLDADRVAQADEAYKAAYSQSIKPTEAMAVALQRPSAEKAMKKAYKNMEDELDTNIRGVEQDGELSTRLVDETLRELRDMAGKAYRSGSKNKGRRLMALEREIRQEAYKSNPALERAMSVYRGAEELKEAADFGVDVLKGKRQVRDYLDVAEDFSESEMDAFRVGLLQGIFDKLESVAWSGDSARKLIPDSRTEDILRQIFKKGDDANEDVFEDFMRKIQNEMEFKATRDKVVGGSITSEVQAGQGARVGRGDQSTLGLVRDIWAAIAGDNPDFTRLTREEYEELAKLMFGKVSDADLEDIVKPTLRTKVSTMDADAALPIMAGMGATTNINRDEGRGNLIRGVEF